MYTPQQPLWRHGTFALMLTLALLLPSVATYAQSTAADNAHFQRTWDRTDHPVAEGLVDRTWMWGPAVSGELHERYDDSPGQQRLVQYFDKARMEINNPDAVDDGLWYVTNGLLAVELIMGRVQVAEHVYQTALPSELNVAGDQGFPNGPSYATFKRFVEIPDHARTPNDRGDAAVVERIDRSGIETRDQSLAAQNVRLAFYDEVTHHNIAAPFWDFMHSSGLVYENDTYVTDGLFENPFYATGRPVTEPFWADVVVAGTEKLVLLQCFERRCLTYTPDNPDGWQVEAGNVGQHYYQWRYAEPPQIDGQLLFYRGAYNAYDLYLVNADGTGLRNLTNDLDAGVYDARWSPDGNRIAFVSTGNLYVIDADGGNREQMTDSGSDAGPAWSPDGTMLAFERRLGTHESQIFIINADGSQERQLTFLAPVDPVGGDLRMSLSGSATWSPDGSRIAFSRNTTSIPPVRRSAIYVIDVDGQHLRVVVAADSYYVMPDWSPDGLWIMFFHLASGRQLEGNTLYKVDPAAEMSAPIVIAGGDASYPRDAVWAPDSDVIAVPLTPVQGYNGDPKWGTRGMHLIDLQTDERTQITHIGEQPNWSPDSQHLAFSFEQAFYVGLEPPTIAITDTRDITGQTQWIVVVNGNNPQWRPGTDSQ